MPKRSSTKSKIVKRRHRDANRSAFDAVLQIIDQSEAEGKDPLAMALGRRGGLKGGKARAAKLSAAARSEIARNAAEARWHRKV